MNKTAEVQILLVEDNPGDVRLTQIALTKGKVANKLHVARDGIEALQFLRKDGDFVDAPRPDLILLDLNLPRKTGREVLEEIKKDQDFKRIPVIVLTTSDAENDILETYNYGANSYITKPVEMADFVNVIASLEEFWFTITRLPPA